MCCDTVWDSSERLASVAVCAIIGIGDVRQGNVAGYIGCVRLWQQARPLWWMRLGSAAGSGEERLNGCVGLKDRRWLERLPAWVRVSRVLLLMAAIAVMGCFGLLWTATRAAD